MNMSTMQLTQKNINIRIDQAEYLDEADINFSGWVRGELDELMEEELDE